MSNPIKISSVLPVVKKRPQVSIKHISTSYYSNYTYTITFEINAHLMKGAPASVNLMPVEAEPYAYPWTSLALKQIDHLIEGKTQMTLELPAISFPGVMGPPAKQFYLLLVSGLHMTSSDDFDFNTSNSGLGEIFTCTKRKKHPPGLVFNGLGRLHMKNYKRWDELVSNGDISTNEKQILTIMSENEGTFDAINAWDDQVLSVGAMQKTINILGAGELPVQLFQFQQAHQSIFYELLGRHGWEFSSTSTKYTDPTTGHIYEGASGMRDLRAEIRKNCTIEKAKERKNMSSYILEPFILLGRNEEFQDKQVIDFKRRLDKILALVPDGFTATVGSFLKSNIGRAVALDHHVNRPSHVEPYLGASLEKLIEKNPSISRNPVDWGTTNHSSYEILLLEIYGYLREKPMGPYGGMSEESRGRYDILKKKFKVTW